MSTNQATSTFENFCLSFVLGFTHNTRVVPSLINDGVFKSVGLQKETPKVPEQMTELARRRAEKQKSKVETPQVQEEEKTHGVRHFLWHLMYRNAIFCVVCILLITHGLVPLIQSIFGRLWNPTAEWAISSFLLSFWLGPMWVLSKLFNVFWMNDLADSAYKSKRGRPAPSEVTVFCSDMVFTSVLELLFILQIVLCSMIPVSVHGFNVIELVLTAISYSLYAFEYKWMNMGYNIHKRLDLIERNLGYHLGFGMPLSLLVMWFDNFWARFIVYSVFFPVLILCATEADEPMQRQTRSFSIFYLSERATRICLRLVHRMVKKFGVMLTLGIFVLVIVIYLTNFIGFLASLLAYLPLGIVADKLQELWEVILERLPSASSTS